MRIRTITMPDDDTGELIIPNPDAGYAGEGNATRCHGTGCRQGGRLIIRKKEKDMDKLLALLKVLFAAVGGWIAARLGGWDTLLAALVGIAVVDIITGLIKAVLKKSEKTASGGVSSGAMWKGGLKKLIMFGLVAVAVYADRLVSPDSSVIRGLVIGYYIATEALSVIENALQCGVPVPDKFKNVFEVMRDKTKTITKTGEDKTE